MIIEWLGPANIETYRITKRRLQLIDQDKLGEQEAAHVRSMISECEYVIQWLRTGHKPGNSRGVERLSGEQRTKLVDPLLMQSYVANSTAGTPNTVTDSDRQRIHEALNTLSPRERECYVMAHGECFSHSDIAKMMDLPKATVSKYIQRAQQKVSVQYYQIDINLVG